MTTIIGELYKEIDTLKAENAELREERDNLHEQIQEYDDALHEQTGYEGEDAPWDVMCCEFERLNSRVAELENLCGEAAKELMGIYYAFPKPQGNILEIAARLQAAQPGSEKEGESE